MGKSTLTNQLAGAAHAAAENYPFCTIDPNVVQCVVPDQKFRYLADTWKPPSIVPAVLKVTDIAGLIRGASEGAGLGNAFLSHIAAVDGIYHLVRAFDSDEVIHVDDSVDPIRDLETIQGELCAKDRESLLKVMERERDKVRKEKGLSRSADVPLSDTFRDAYDKCHKLIEANTPVQTYEDFNAAEVEVIRDWGLSTCLVMVLVAGGSETWSFPSSLSLFAGSIVVSPHPPAALAPSSCSFSSSSIVVNSSSNFTLSLTLVLAHIQLPPNLSFMWSICRKRTFCARAVSGCPKSINGCKVMEVDKSFHCRVNLNKKSLI